MNWFRWIFHSKKQDSKLRPSSLLVAVGMAAGNGKKAQEAVHGALSEQAYVYFCSPDKTRDLFHPGLQARQLSLSFLISFCGLYQNTAKDEYNTNYAQNNPEGNREFFKEITGQTDSKNSFAQITHKFRDKFPAGVVNDWFHCLNNIIVKPVRQEKLPGGVLP